MRPVPHVFSYRLFMMYLDLAELPNLFARRRFWSARKPALARFRRSDHFGDPSVPLDESVRRLVERETGVRPEGPIRLLTHLRYFGHVFNPVSFYYCFDGNSETVETIVAEVNNTPWGERHCYVLPQHRDHGSGDHHRYRPEKAMHVSPFMEMDVEYDWRFNNPADRLTVHMENSCGGRKTFDATLDLNRKEISSSALTGVLLAYPLMTVRIIVAIYWQAALLWLKGTPVHDHPSRIETAAEKAK